jgi:CheY-like chemotaxis protein
VSARILVIEDEPLVRELMLEVLTEVGFQVDEAEDGEQALKLIDALLLSVRPRSS